MKKNEIKLKRGKTIGEVDLGNGYFVELYDLLPIEKESDSMYNLTQGEI